MNLHSPHIRTHRHLLYLSCLSAHPACLVRKRQPVSKYSLFHAFVYQVSIDCKIEINAYIHSCQAFTRAVFSGFSDFITGILGQLVRFPPVIIHQSSVHI